MQQLARDMKEMEEVLQPLCEEMMAWKAAHLFEDFKEVSQPMTAIVSLAVNNQRLFLEYGIPIGEEEVLGYMKDMASALEMKDEIKLLDAVYRGYLPWLRKLRKRIEDFLKGREG